MTNTEIVRWCTRDSTPLVQGTVPPKVFRETESSVNGKDRGEPDPHENAREVWNKPESFRLGTESETDGYTNKLKLPWQGLQSRSFWKLRYRRTRNLNLNLLGGDQKGKGGFRL